MVQLYSCSHDGHSEKRLPLSRKVVGCGGLAATKAVVGGFGGFRSRLQTCLCAATLRLLKDMQTKQHLGSIAGQCLN